MRHGVVHMGIVVAGAALLAACGQVQEVRNTYNAVSASTRAARNMGAALQQARQQRADRAKTGDTLALPYQALKRYLPARIAGFEAEGAPTGESVQVSGMHYSTCEQRYRKGDQHLTVQLVDYNGANALYSGATALMSAGFSQENDEQLMRGCSLGVDKVQGWETLQKKERKASVALGVGDRFFVAVDADQQDNTEFVKQAARSLDLHALAQL